jgi:hypothetical protein
LNKEPEKRTDMPGSEGRFEHFETFEQSQPNIYCNSAHFELT